MKRQLWVVNVILLGLVALTASVLRQRWVEARQREQALLQQMVPVAPAPPLAALAPVSAATPANYLEVAQKMVFSRDRNSIVILDPPPPPPPAPPPEPMPALPVAYGIMNLGSGPTAIMAEKPGAPSKGYRAGESIGAFKIVAMNNQEILFAWKDKQVKKTLEELVDKSARNVAAAPPPAESAPAPAAPQVTSLGTVKAGPGVELGSSTRACVAGDTSPAGTVEGGMRKVVTKTPFGESCRWEPVK